MQYYRTRTNHDIFDDFLWFLMIFVNFRFYHTSDCLSDLQFSDKEWSKMHENDLKIVKNIPANLKR